MRTLGLETRYACRSIVQRPLLAAIVVITLASVWAPTPRCSR